MTGFERGSNSTKRGGWGRGRGRGRGRGGNRNDTFIPKKDNYENNNNTSNNNNNKSDTQKFKHKTISVELKASSPLVDIGANLCDRRFRRDIDQVLARAKEAHVNNMVITGTTERESQDAIKLASKHPDTLAATVGIHPHYVKNASDNAMELLREWATEHSDVVKSIGETGLDYNRNLSPPKQQREWFRAHVQLACDLGLPLFLHEREAHKDFMEILNSFSDQNLPPVVVHCFTGNEHEATRYIDEGYYLGFTGIVCKQDRGRDLREKVLPNVPLDRLMVETDCPFMTPNNTMAKQLGRRNEPFTLPHVVRTIADVKGVEEREVAEASSRNAFKFFNL